MFGSIFKHKIVKLVISISTPIAAGALLGTAHINSLTPWYLNLVKPFFTPPSLVFAPVWTALYAMMGLALYYVWTSKSKNRDLAFVLFFLQLILNLMWSILFFSWQSPVASLIEMVALWFCILVTILVFRKVSKTAAYLMIPYIVWVTFTALINAGVIYLN